MSAEQHQISSPPEGVRPPEWKYDAKKHLDVYSMYVRFWDDSRKLGLSAAKQRRRLLLEANFRSYTQENNALSAIYPVAIEVNRREDSSSALRFRHSYHDDIAAGFTEELARVRKGKLQTRFRREQEAYLRVWSTALDSLLPHVGAPPAELIPILHQHGFRRSVRSHSEYLSQKKTKGVADSACIFDHISGAAALYPELSSAEELEVYESPQWYGFLSPNSPFHQEGQTSIGRLAKVFYLPLIHKLFIADEGLYTGYRGELTELLELDEQERQIPTNEKDVLAFIAVLSQEKYATLAPHAIFQEIIDRIGYFTPAPIGEGVRTKETRNFSRQLQYIESIFDFEYARCCENPELLSTLSERFAYANETVMHALLRANDETLEVESLTALYQTVFGLDLNAYNPAGLKRLMNVKTVSIYSDFFNRAQSLGDCAIGTFRVGGLDALTSASTNIQTANLAFGGSFDLGNGSLQKLKEGIVYRRTHDFHTAAEARAFASMYNINPEWIGTVINHYPSGKHCDECKHPMHWVGECGGHTMCLQCNAEYNLDHGLVSGQTESTDAGSPQTDGLKDDSFVSTIGIGAALSAVTTGDWEQFQRPS